jgi:hypothetical protein
MAGTRAEQNAIELVRRLYQAVIATINETPQGAPGGPMYAALMQYISLDQFQTMMDSLVHARRIRREGGLYFPPAK